MPDAPVDQAPKKLSYLENLVNTAKNELSAKLEDSLDASITKALPDSLRVPWIKTAAEQISFHFLNHPYSDEETEGQPIIEKARLAEIIDKYLINANQPLSNFISPKTKQVIIDQLDLSSEKIDQFKQAQQAAFEARNLRLQNPLNSSTTAKTLLDQIPDDKKFGLSQSDTEGILIHLRNQPSIINNPTKKSIKTAIEAMVENHQKLGLTKEVAEIFGQQLLKEENLDLTHHYVLSATDPLPQATPFSPHTPVVTPKDLRQARALNVSPLALSYAKSGFSADNPVLSNDLQAEVQQIHAYLKNPLSPQHKLSLSGTVTAALLKPLVKLSQSIYHPVYKVIEAAKKETNQVILKPFTLYKTIQKKYQVLKNEKALGWLIAPRMRLRLVTNNLKLKLKTWASKQTLVKPVIKAQNSLKSFWNKWSPKGIRTRVGGWIGKKSIEGTARFGSWLTKKGVTHLGKIFSKSAEKAADATVAATGVGIPLLIFKLVLSLGFASFKKLKKQIKKDRRQSGSFDFATNAIRIILNALKSLSMLAFGTIGGVIGTIAGGITGALIGFALGGPVGAIIGGIVGAIGGGLAIGSIGALLGWNILTIAAIPVAIGSFFFGTSGILGGGLIGAPAAGLATQAVGVSMVSTGTAAFLSNAFIWDVIKDAFFLPTDNDSGPSSAKLIVSGLASICPEGGEEITEMLASQTLDGQVNLLPNSLTIRQEKNRICIEPTMIIVHWSGGFDIDSGNQATFDTLVARDRTCQLASDTNDVLFMLPFYETQIEMSWCAGPNGNPYSINNEIAGGFTGKSSYSNYEPIDIRFTDQNGNPARTGDPMRPNQTIFPDQKAFDRAVNSTCVVMKQYDIPTSQIFGHYQIQGSGKSDPGEEFLQNWFIPEVTKQCG